MEGGGQRHAPGKTRYPLYRRLGGPQGRSGFDPRDRPARSESLYRLSCPGPTNWLYFHNKPQHNWITSGFSREVDEFSRLLRYSVAYGDSSLPKFRDNLSVPSSRATKYKARQISCPETSGTNCHIRCVISQKSADLIAQSVSQPSSQSASQSVSQSVSPLMTSTETVPWTPFNQLTRLLTREDSTGWQKWRLPDWLRLYSASYGLSIAVGIVNDKLMFVLE
jgi:hypothetical protein